MKKAMDRDWGGGPGCWFITFVLMIGVPRALGELVNPPRDLLYLGAFRLPGPSGGSSWEWSGEGLTYCPEGDPNGAGDGFPGSLYGIGHDWDMFVSEISIPAPVSSTQKNVNALNTAATLQPFTDVRPFNPGGTDMLLGDVEYLPPQGTQTAARLHCTWGRYFQFEKCVSQGWSGLNLSNPDLAGGWFVGPSNSSPANFSVDSYLFAIPEAWAAAHAAGRRLATGRFHGGISGQGPSVFAIAPWQHGDPPLPNTVLGYTTLLKYEDPVGPHTMTDWREADEWWGGAWLTTSGGKESVVFVGTKASGDCWYGFADGSRFPDCLPGCANYQDRGWWASGMRASFLFYDPADLAAVAAGTKPSYEPQPYALLDVNGVLFRAHTVNSKRRLGACAFDAERGFLYVLDPLSDGDKSLVHVWKLLDQPRLSLDATPPVRLRIEALRPGSTYEIRSTTNLLLADRPPRGTLSATGAVHQWLETESTARRFYRLQSAP